MSIRLLLLFVFFIFFKNTQAQLNITTTNLGTQLAQKLVGSGVSISNVTFSAPTNSCGLFTSRLTPIPFDSGILLTSGIAKTNVSLNDVGVDGIANDFLFGQADTDHNAPGDAQLATIIRNNLTTHDAAVLEFDFVPLGDTITFNYVFSSEEYPNYNCTPFNDAFAFFINGPGITGTINLAQIPNTNLPVTINNINDGVDGDPTDTISCGSVFTSLYVDNSGGIELTHNGLTVRLRAKTAVQPCQTYHLKIVIADVSDGSLDSGVFLEAGSLNSLGVNISSQGLVDASTNTQYLAEGCNTGTIAFTLPAIKPLPTIVNLTIAGTATNGVDITTIPNTITIPANTLSFSLPISAFNDALVENTEFLKIYVSSSCGSGAYLDSTIIEVRDYRTLTITPDTGFICTIGTPIQLTATTGYSNYLWDANTTLNNINIANPIGTPTTLPTTYYCTATVGTCRARDSVYVMTKTTPTATIQNVDCRNGATGSITIQTSADWVNPQFTLNGGTPQSSNVFNNLIVGSYTIVVSDGGTCSRTVTANIIQAFPDLTFTEVVTAPVCATPGTIIVTPSGGRTPYQYSLNGTTFNISNILSINNTGTYTVYVRDANNCITTKTVTVTSANFLNITNTTIIPAGCTGIADGSVTLAATGSNPPLQYSSNNTTFQTSNVLLLTAGPHTVYVKDANGCVVNTTVIIPINNNLIVNAGVDTIICESGSVQLNATASGSTNLWTPNNNITGATTLTPTVTPTISTAYYLTTTRGVCSKTDTVLVTVRPAPIANTGADTTICYGAAIQLNGSGGTTYQWQPNTAIVGANTATPTINPTSNTTYWVMVKDVFGCSSLKADTVQITVTPPIVIKATNDTLIAVNQPLQLNAVGTPLYNWQPSNWLNNPTIANPVAIINQTGTVQFYVTGFTQAGCLGYDTVNVVVYKGPEIYVPTAFTPNNDGTNDLLKITTVGLQQLKYFNIYNRWGQLVFTTKDATVGWRGLYNSKVQPSGTYVWMVEGVTYLGKTITKKGTLILIR